MTADSPLARIRLAGSRMLVCVFWLNVPALAVAAMLSHRDDAVLVPLAGALLALMPTFALWRRALGPANRMAMAVTAMAYPALYLFLLRDEPWQMDMHMAFFAAMAGITVLLDRRALVGAAFATAAHHLLLNYIHPAWVFSSSADLSRVMLHALLLSLQTAMLLWIVQYLTGFIHAQAADRARSEALRGEAQAARLTAEDALRQLEAAQVAAEHQRAAEEAARRAQEAAERRRLVADALEARLGVVIGDLGQLARQLSDSKRGLFNLLDSTTQRSADLRAAHARAESDVRSVATGTERLASSIHEVGSSASNTRDTAHRGAMVTRALTPEVAALSTTVDAASSIVAMISTIAAQSRTLSFNAGIEAARSGSDTRGFAIVASEMKMLATQTAEATRQIDAYLGDIRTAAKGVSGAIEVAARQVESIDASASRIVTEVDEQIRATSTIAVAADEMADHIAQAAHQVEALGDMLAQAHVAMGLTDSVASALSSRSQELQETIRSVLKELRAA